MNTQELKLWVYNYFKEVKYRHIYKIDKYVRTVLSPSSEFWDLWKSEKDELRKLGVGSSFYNDEWQATLWSKNPIPSFFNDIEGIKEEETEEETEEEIEEETEEEKKEKALKLISEIVIPEITNKLLSYQISHFKDIITAFSYHKVVADTSDTGTGKTYTALAAIKALKYKAFIICPSPVISGWERAIEHFDCNDQILGVVNYELIKNGKYIVKSLSKKRRKNKITGEMEYYTMSRKVKCPYFSIEDNPSKKEQYQPKKLMEWIFEDPEHTIIIWDEAHRCKNRNTQNSQMMIQASKQNIPQFLLSATLAENPMKMYGTGMALKLFSDPSKFISFVSKYGCEKVKVNRYRSVWQFTGTSDDILAIKKEIGNMACGMDVENLRKQNLFPSTKIIADPINFNGNGKKIQAIYEEMFEKIAELKSKMSDFNYIGMHLPKIQKERQMVELLKIPSLVTMIKDQIENNLSVAVFLNFTESIKQLQTSLSIKKIHSVTLYGSNTRDVNETHRLKFQKNEVNVIICNTASGKEGIDLHDENHERRRVSYISPDYNPQTIKQVLGRIDRAGGTSSIQYLLIASDTIEEQIYNKVVQKIINIQTFNERKNNLVMIEGGIDG